MKKIHIKENAKIVSMFDEFPDDDDEFVSDLDLSSELTDIGEYANENEKDIVEGLDYEWMQLKDDIFSFRKHIEEVANGVASDRAKRELNNIFEEVKLMTDLQE